MSEKKDEKRNEDPQGGPVEDYSFLQETVKDEQQNTKGFMGNLCRLAGRGLVFGIAASLAFYALRPWAMTHLGGEKVTIPLDQEETPAEDEEDTTPSQDTKEEIQYPELTVENYQELQKALYHVAVEAGKSVAEVRAIQPDEDWENTQESQSGVSGVIFWDNGSELLIAAPARSVKDAASLKVTFSDNNTYNAALKKQDRNLGLAIVAVKKSDLSDTTRSQIQIASLGNSNVVGRGEGVIVLGNPFGFSSGLGYGIISSTKNTISVADGQYKVLNTDITGVESSSGVLFNIAGEVVGLADQSLSDEGSNLITAYAISEIKEEIQLLANGKGVPYLGIHGVVVTEKIAEEQEIPQGIYVREVDADSPAMQAGIQNGDIITTMNKTDITTLAGYNKKLMESDVGAQIRIKAQRQGASGYVEVSFDATVGSKE